MGSSLPIGTFATRLSAQALRRRLGRGGRFAQRASVGGQIRWLNVKRLCDLAYGREAGVHLVVLDFGQLLLRDASGGGEHILCHEPPMPFLPDPLPECHDRYCNQLTSSVHLSFTQLYLKVLTRLSKGNK